MEVDAAVEGPEVEGAMTGVELGAMVEAEVEVEAEEDMRAGVVQAVEAGGAKRKGISGKLPHTKPGLL